MPSHVGFGFGIIPRRRLHHTNDEPQESFITLKSEIYHSLIESITIL